jgi:beta-lactamase superfamily II metal-dependent hydrolase
MMRFVAQDFTVNVDFAVLRDENDKPKTVLAWGDPVRMIARDDERIEVEAVDFVESGGGLQPVPSKGFLKRRIRVGGKDREVALPAAEVKVLRISFVDVQQGDATLIQTPQGRVITIDGGENKLFARFLASRLRGSSGANPQEIDAMVVSHGDADHFAGLSLIHESETHQDALKRLVIHPRRVFHNGLVKRPDKVPELESFGATAKVGEDTVVTGLESDLLAVPESEMNKHFKAWKEALAAWAKHGPIQFQRLAKDGDAAFSFLADEQIAVEVLGPIETRVNGTAGLKFLRGPKRSGDPMPHLSFEPGATSASHTINGHSIVLRLTFGDYRMLFAGDLNNAAEEALIADPGVDLTAEVFKVPHHGSHEFTPGFLKAVSPLVSVVSSGDESERTEFIHPRATLTNALGRCSRDDTALVFVTEMVAFFKLVGESVSAPAKGKGRPYFGFERSAFGCVRVRTDGKHLLVFTDTGKRDVHEAYAYDTSAPGVVAPGDVRKA